MIHKIFSYPMFSVKYQKHFDDKLFLIKQIELFCEKHLISSVQDINQSISKTDWFIDKKIKREYFSNLSDKFIHLINPFFLEYFSSKVYIVNYWFQHYIRDDFHDWHTHQGVDYSCVYYLNLNSQKQLTEFKDPITNQNFTVNCNEGDILCFPSAILHRSPKNDDSLEKTVISFNVNLTQKNTH